MIRSWVLALAVGAAACGYRSNPTQPATPEVQSVALGPANPSLTVGQSVQLTATPYDSHGQVVTGVSVTWASAAPAIARVDANGLVTGVAAGHAQISASVAGANGALTVTVGQ